MARLKTKSGIGKPVAFCVCQVGRYFNKTDGRYMKYLVLFKFHVLLK